MKVTPELIKKYHQDRCTPAEKQAVEVWLLTPEWSSDVFSLGEENLPETLDFVTKQKLSWKRVMAVAASLVMVLGAGWIGFNKLNPSREIVLKSVSTQRGEIKELHLQDGTRIVLNSESSIQFPDKFTDSTRDVKLCGEAYFEVAKDPQRRFKIQTEKSEVKVLGTEFNLKAYKGENQELRVNEGKVSFNSLGSKETPRVLVAREYAILETSTGVIDQRTERIEVRDHWYGGGLTVNDMTLKDLIPILERRFDITVKVKNQALLKKSYTGSHKSVSIRSVFDDLSFVLNCNYKQSENVIEIY